jgi:hypothetical protein
MTAEATGSVSRLELARPGAHQAGSSSIAKAKFWWLFSLGIVLLISSDRARAEWSDAPDWQLLAEPMQKTTKDCESKQSNYAWMAEEGKFWEERHHVPRDMAKESQYMEDLKACLEAGGVKVQTAYQETLQKVPRERITLIKDLYAKWLTYFDSIRPAPDQQAKLAYEQALSALKVELQSQPTAPPKDAEKSSSTGRKGTGPQFR